MRLNRNRVYTPAENPEAHTVQRVIEMLDDIAAGYEARWGIDRLPKLVSDDLRQKWQSQIGKLNDAIDRNHPADVETLVQGTLRGWQALEAQAVQNGHKPLDPDAWECIHASGTVYRVARNNRDALAVKGRIVVTLTNLVNIYHAAMTGQLDGPEIRKVKQENNPLPDGGDELPF